MNADSPINPDELQAIVTAAQQRNSVRLTQLGQWEYLRFIRKFRSIPEGTAVFENNFIWGYPKIGRILRLSIGIEAHFDKAFWAEEKIDGYNVRIFRHGDTVLALTRRGYICPFTTDRLVDLLDTDIFEDYPDLVLCAEVAGPDNPYNEGNPPFIQEDVRLFVFDMMHQGQPGFVPHRDKMRLLETYGLPGVPQFGRYLAEEWEKLRVLLLRLNREGREGIVLKEDSSRERRVKYVTGNINISDIRVSERGIQQLPAEYFMHRVLRLALFLEEHGIEPTAALYQELGESLVKGTLEAIKQYHDQHKVYHTYRCRFRQRSNAEWMMHVMQHHLGRGQVRQCRLEKTGEFYLLEFDKILPRTTGLFGHILGGGIVFD